MLIDAQATAGEEPDEMQIAQATHSWTLEELHRLPEDGNSYELVHGELFVTPPPSVEHEEVRAVLGALLVRYVEAHRLGRVYQSHAVVQTDDSQVEPDLIVRPLLEKLPVDWRHAPRPLLVVEILSSSTRRRDLTTKRELYLEEGIPEYWIVDRWERTVRVVRAGATDRVHGDALTWHPTGAGEPLVMGVPELFREALG